MGRRAAVFDCPSGASGDMVLAALIDAGAPMEPIVEALRRAGLAEVQVGASRVRRGGVEALRLEVRGAPESGLAAGELRRLVEAAGLPARARERALRALSLLAAAETAVHGGVEATFHEVGGIDTAVDLIGSALAL
ncbi:MAG: pyridinium-3,5-bisthiocarboxylic acid mononucleotide nickel chelatase, partial [Chloroflexota bacterium]|nr:LarC family nickel insertion protein [Dehalococcoidia bacterium]MDW8047522.1 pyridinium-3,5-bisthiocarboxylic acid mononucleotide nickel chelatase [Chloroflexota bacterium]